jgi:hypothetical protein
MIIEPHWKLVNSGASKAPPIQTEPFRRPGETDVDQARKPVEIDDCGQAKQRDEATCYEKQRLVDVIEAESTCGCHIRHHIPPPIEGEYGQGTRFQSKSNFLSKLQEN